MACDAGEWPGALDADGFFRAAHAYLGRSTAALATLQIDDLTDERTPVNVPTTSAEHPNWRRRLSQTLEQLAVNPRLAVATRMFKAERTNRGH